MSEVIVNIKASGVNRADLMQAKGHYPPPRTCEAALEGERKPTSSCYLARWTMDCLSIRRIGPWSNLCHSLFPNGGGAGKWQASNDGGGFAVWSKNGRELFYLNPQPHHLSHIHHHWRYFCTW